MNERMETNNPEATEALGEKLGREARAGQIYCLSGDLGVGKTVFTKGFAKGLGITEHVTSAMKNIFTARAFAWWNGRSW